MSTVKFIKRKIIYFCFCLLFGCVIFSNFGSSSARENVYLSCLIDDESFMYKTQVIMSGEEIELGRIGLFCNLDLAVNNPQDFLKVYDYACLYDSEFASSVGIEAMVGSIDENTGKITIQATINGEIVDGQEIPANIWGVLGSASGNGFGENSYAIPYKNILTFPAGETGTSKESDINRAYAVSSLMGDNFRDALLYINDGKSFTSVDALVDTAYALVSVEEKANIITNQFGTKYRVEYKTDPSYDDAYTYECKITRINSSADDKMKSFVYMVKKGYQDCDTEDYFEDGTKNNLNFGKSDPEYDTAYITWQQMFLEAGILYAQGISYSNQADLYSIDSFESSLIKVARNFISGIKNKLQLYTTEDCIFNNSIRGSQAFVYGIFKTDFNTGIFKFYMVMLSISLSLVVISVIRVIIKKEWSTASPMSRYSILNGLKDIIFILIVLASLWLLMEFVFVINFKFVDIWDTYLNGKTMSDSGGYNSLSALLYSFIFFVIQTYINILYILRGYIVPVLMIIAPVCVFVYCMGDSGKRVSGTWLKEFLGNTFIQSVHALVYGFILVNSNGLRGIEALVVCASIIPLTSVIKDVTGIGGNQLIQKAGNLAGNTVSAIGTGGALVGSAVGSVASGVGNVATKVGDSVGGVAGTVSSVAGNFTKTGAGIAKASGGAFNIGMGAGDMVVLDKGQSNVTMGASQVSSGVSMSANGLSDAMSETVTAGKGYISNKALNNSFENRTNSSFGNPQKIVKNANGTKTAHFNPVTRDDVNMAEALYGNGSTEHIRTSNLYELANREFTDKEKQNLAVQTGMYVSSSKKGVDITYKDDKTANYVSLAEALGNYNSENYSRPPKVN